MSGRKRGREAPAARAAWEPCPPFAEEGEAYLGALFGGGGPGLHALIRRGLRGAMRWRDAR